VFYGDYPNLPEFDDMIGHHLSKIKGVFGYQRPMAHQFMDRVSLVGAGGHARSLLGLAHAAGIQVIEIFDRSYDLECPETILGVPVTGAFPSLHIQNPILLAIGDNAERSRLFDRLGPKIYAPNLIHPTTVLGPQVRWGNSNQVFAGSILNSQVTLGANNILNSGCIIEHDSVIGSGNHISVGSVLCGGVQLGNDCLVGAGAVVLPNKKIVDDVIIGAGAVVTKDILQPGTYVGNPARNVG